MGRLLNMAQEFLIVTAKPTGLLECEWEDFLLDCDFATHYVTTDFFSDPFVGHGDRFAVLAISDGRIDAILTGLRNGAKVLSGLAVRPQTAFRRGVDRGSVARWLVKGVAEYAGNGVDLIKFHSWHPILGLDNSGFRYEACSSAESVVMLDLSKGPDALFKDFSERRRTDVRKVMKQGKLSVKPLETEDEVAELYEVHKDWNTRKGNAPDTYDAFRRILNSQHRATFIAINEGRIVAGTYLRFCPHGLVEYAANNSLVEFQKLRPNELLAWRAIEWACSSGFTRFSLGASHPFLARFGGELISAHRYQLDRSFLKLHTNRERLSRMIIRTYLAMPEKVRTRIRAVAKV